MSLSIRMSAATNKHHIDKVIKNNKRLKSAFHSRKLNRNAHRVALDELDTFLELVDEAMDAMNETRIELEKTQEKLYELYDFCGEVPLDESCDYYRFERIDMYNAKGSRPWIRQTRGSHASKRFGFVHRPISSSLLR